MLQRVRGTRSDALFKLARAARLSAQAAKLYAEAAEVLSEADVEHAPPTRITEVDAARARRALKKAGVRI